MSIIDKSLAMSYNSANSYKVGDKVIYNNKMYKCTSVTNGGSFDESSWERTYLMNEMADQTSNLGNIEVVYNDAALVTNSQNIAASLSYTVSAGKYLIFAWTGYRLSSIVKEPEITVNGESIQRLTEQNIDSTYAKSYGVSALITVKEESEVIATASNYQTGDDAHSLAMIIYKL